MPPYCAKQQRLVSHLFPRQRVPEFDGAVARGTRETPAVGTVGHGIDGVLMADQASESTLELSQEAASLHDK